MTTRTLTALVLALLAGALALLALFVLAGGDRAAVLEAGRSSESNSTTSRDAPSPVRAPPTGPDGEPRDDPPAEEPARRPVERSSERTPSRSTQRTGVIGLIVYQFSRRSTAASLPDEA